MPGKIGTSTIYTTILPKQFVLDRVCTKKLSREAKHRLKVLDYYFHKAGKNVSLTARHFGCTRSYIYKWLKRFNPRHLESLEGHSRRPHHTRKPQYDYETIALIREYREDKATCFMSEKKLANLLREEQTDPRFYISAATIGRIIKRFGLYSHRLKQYTKHRRRTVKQWSALKRRRPAGLVARNPRKLIEFDMKHIYVHNRKFYAMCSIDPATREASIHLAKNASSRQAKIALMETIQIYGQNIAILNDNGSENRGEAWDFLEEQKITQFFAHPYAPKEKPFIERFIGSLQRECLDVYRDDILTEKDLVYYVTQWLNDYHFRRPHQSLKYQTPYDFCDKLGITIERREVSMM